MKTMAVALTMSLAALSLGGCISVTRTETAASPPTTTTVVAPPGTTTAVVTPARPWCQGAYAAPGGSNFGACATAR
jgi:hypothetical protein